MPSTPEHDIPVDRVRVALLNVLFRQWSLLGAPATASAGGVTESVVDPEALIRASIERLDDEPRLADVMGSWLHRHRTTIIRARVVASRPVDPVARARVEHLHRELAGGRHDGLIQELGGSRSATVWRRVISLLRGGPDAPRASGSLAPDPAAALVRARLVLGADTRHIVIVHLLCAGRARPVDVHPWSGFGRRAIKAAFDRLSEAGAIVARRGGWSLAQPEGWRVVLGLGSPGAAPPPLVVVDWTQAFRIVNELVSDLERAREIGFDQSTTTVASRLEHASTALLGCIVAPSDALPAEIQELRRAIEGPGGR